MTHASQETLVAYADGELIEAEERQAALHLESCAECAARLATIVESRAQVALTLAQVDAMEPARWDSPEFAERALAAVAAGAAATAGDPPAEPEATIDLVEHRALRARRAQPVRSPARQTALRWAAGLVLVAGAAAAAIVTPAVIERVLTEPGPVAERIPEGAGTASGAVAVRPVDGSVSIALTGAVEGTRIRVAFEQRQDVNVEYSAGEAPGFTARDGVIEVAVVESGTTLTVGVPADVREARVLVDGVEAALLARGEIVRTRPDLNVIIEVTNTGR
ncbi:MAG: hypothetical protein GX539_00985 [Candidatus Cloacimonetes bacterium]|jgi:anti-sigma factor RsiW|nr:hypothetical protein [Candidatus Cloacimonadota bacterium]